MAITAQLVNELRQKTGAGMMDCKRALTESGGDLDKAVTWLREKGMATAGKCAVRAAAEGRVEVAVLDGGRGGVMVDVNCETDFVARSEDFQAFCKLALDTVCRAASLEGIGAQLEDARKAVVAKTGENVVVRRQERFNLPAGSHGRVEIYLHMGGKIGAMVELEADGPAAAEHPAFLELCHDVAMQVAAASPTYLERGQVPAELLEAERSIYLKQGLEEGKPQNVVEKMIEGRVQKWYKEICLVDQLFIKEQKVSVKDVVKAAEEKAGGKIEIRRFVRFQLGEGIEKKKSDLAAEVAAQIEAAGKA
jgi:elongation factor Ts